MSTNCFWKGLAKASAGDARQARGKELNYDSFIVSTSLNKLLKRRPNPKRPLLIIFKHNLMGHVGQWDGDDGGLISHYFI
jgi:hypothetical protein